MNHDFRYIEPAVLRVIVVNGVARNLEWLGGVIAVIHIDDAIFKRHGGSEGLEG